MKNLTSVMLFFILIYSMVLGSLNHQTELFFYILLLLFSSIYVAKKGVSVLFMGRPLLFVIFILINIFVGLIYAVNNMDYEYVASFYEKSYFLHQNLRYAVFLLYFLFLVWLLLQNSLKNNLKCMNIVYFVHVGIGVAQELLSRFNLFPSFSQKYGFREVFIFSGYRIDGFALEATGYAYVLVTLFMCRFMYLKSDNRKLHFIECILFLYLLVHTFSRGVWLSFSISLVLSCLLTVRMPKKINFKIVTGSLVILLFCISAALFAIYSNKMNQLVDDVYGFYNTEFSSESYVDQFYSRPRLFKLAFKAFSESPIFGIGTGNYHKYVSWDYNLFGTWGTINDYLQVLSENGIFGLLLYLAFLLIPYFQYYKYEKSFQNKSLLGAAMLCNINMLIIGNSINNLFNPTFWFTNALLTYILIVHLQAIRPLEEYKTGKLSI